MEDNKKQNPIAQPLAIIESKWPRLFMGMVHHKTTNGGQLTFADKRWLEDIYKDNNSHMTVIKCAQVHMTEHFLCALHTLARAGLRGMYILPSDTHRGTFVKDRVNRLQDYSPLYKEATKAKKTREADSNVYKVIFGSGWKFVGSNVKGNFFEFPCDVLIMDEFDLLNMDNIEFSYDRIENSKDKHIYKFGNPTRDGFGIHAEWLESDQKEWHVQCPHCETEHILDWHKHFVVKKGTAYYLRSDTGEPVCDVCHKTFDRLGPGRWVQQNPDCHSSSGYRISRLFVNKEPDDVQKLFKRFIKALDNPSKMQVFCNNYLAETYEDAQFRITEGLLQQCANVSAEDRVAVADLVSKGLIRTVAGVDQGRLFTVVIKTVFNGKLYDLQYDVVDTWEQLEGLLDHWNTSVAVIDAQGGGYQETREFVRKHGERWMCYYRGKDRVTGEYTLKYEENVVDTNRTEILDTMVTWYKRRKIVIPMTYKTDCNGDYFKEMLVPARKLNAKGEPEWTKGKDHFFHASGYSHLAWLISGMSDGTRKERSWLVEQKTPEGKHNVQKIIERGSIGMTNEEYEEAVEEAHRDRNKKPERKSWFIQ